MGQKGENEIRRTISLYAYRISEGLGLDMNFIQRVVCFMSPSFGDGEEKTQGGG